MRSQHRNRRPGVRGQAMLVCAAIWALIGLRPSLLYAQHNTYDLGSAAQAPRDIYFAGQLKPVTKPAVTGSRGGNAALGSLISALASLGLITDSTTA